MLDKHHETSGLTTSLKQVNSTIGLNTESIIVFEVVVAFRDCLFDNLLM